jgi:hypothetical protein
MADEYVISTVGCALGIVGTFIVITPYISEHKVLGLVLNSTLAIILGIVGFILTRKAKEKLSDEVTTAGMIVNPIAIIVGIIALFI